MLKRICDHCGNVIDHWYFKLDKLTGDGYSLASITDKYPKDLHVSCLQEWSEKHTPKTARLNQRG
jgi:hypothetical protein